MMGIVSKYEADLVLGMYKNFNKNEEYLPDIFRKYADLNKAIRVTDNLNAELFWNVNSCGKLYKKELIQNLYFLETINYIEDQPFSMYTYLNAKKIFLAPSIIYYYRTREQFDSLSLVAPKKPLSSLKNIFSSFEIGKEYFEPISDNNIILFNIYISRVVAGSLKYIFEGVIKDRDELVHRKVFEEIIHWINSLDPWIVSNDGFRQVFVENATLYMNLIDNTSAKLYIELLRVIKTKMQLAVSEE